jgi:hypothetical protein
MPEWIEPINKEQAKAAKQLPVIPLRWEATTVPEIPVRLPISASLNVAAHGIQVHAERKARDYDEEDEEIDVQFRKEDIVCVDIVLLPEIDENGRETRYLTVDYRSRAVIRHRDPFEVVPYFESIFACDNVYWLRALSKAVKDRLGVKQTFSETKRP